jgi:hypothetical protein
MIVSTFTVLQLLAKTHVESACDKKRNYDPYKDEIAHKSPYDEANLQR